jgi:hypothetical protein
MYLMPTLPTGELPKPKSWDEFEEIIWDIFLRKWNDPHAKRYGRSGQEQQGVDVYGQPAELQGGYAGVQCKRYEDEKLTRKVIEAEILKAESFQPPLALFILATTANRDARLQEAVREINLERTAGGKFQIELLFWEDLSHELLSEENHDLLKRHYAGWIEVFQQQPSPGNLPGVLAGGRGLQVNTSVPSRLKDSLVGVLNQDGLIVGTGFIVDRSLVLTCEHVVTAAGSAPGKSVRLRLELNGSEVQARVDARYGSPRSKDDIAVLRLEHNAPQGAAPLELRSAESSNGHAFQTFGYPRLEMINGLGGRGTIIETVTTVDGRKLLQLDSSQLDSGFSGAPVWDNDLLKVVGMVRSPLSWEASGRQADTYLAVPSEVLLESMPRLSRQTARALANPFYAGGAVPPELFAGRKDTLRLIQSSLSGPTLQNISIVAERRMGKTSLLRYVCEHVASLFPQNTVVVCLNLLEGYARTRVDLLRALREKLAEQLERQPWKEALDGDLGEFSRALEYLSRSGLRLVLCLDEIEMLSENEAEFGGLFDALRSAADGKPFAMLVTSARPLAKLKKEHGSTSPFYNIFVQQTLGLLKADEWRELVVEHMDTVTPEELNEIGRLAGGHPFFTQLAARRLWEARFAGGDPEWQLSAFDDLTPHWEGWWKHLKPAEQDAVRYSLGLPAPVPKNTLLRDLVKRGLLLRDDGPFSAAFAEWVREL